MINTISVETLISKVFYTNKQGHKMLLKLFKPQIPKEFMRMVRIEYKSVKPEFVEYFYEKYNRLPSMEELRNAS